MKRILALSVLGLMIVGTAFAANDMSRLGEGYFTPAPQGPSHSRSVADILICSWTDGTFTDLSPQYDAAAGAAGASTSVIVETLPSTPFPFPAPMTSAEYPTLIVLGNDIWWDGAEQNISLTDEAVLSAYQDTGGNMLFSAQDYLYARGNVTGYPQIYLGILSYVDDINFSDTDIDYTGVAGGAIAGMTGSLHAEAGPVIGPCFLSNPFFTDDITPFFLGLADYTSYPTVVSGQCGTTTDLSPAFKTIFTTMDFACTDNTAQFQGVFDAMYAFLAGSVPVEDATWGSVKEMYK